jgi:hypothetical protein
MPELEEQELTDVDKVVAAIDQLRIEMTKCYHQLTEILEQSASKSDDKEVKYEPKWVFDKPPKKRLL